MTVVAAVRGSSVNFPLFLHVLGAMLLVGTLLAVAVALLISWRRRWAAPGLVRFGLLALPIGVLPAYVLMRIGAQWTESREHLGDLPEDPSWLGVGYVAADAGAVLILVSLVLAFFGLRRLRAGSGGTRPAAAAGIISVLLLAAYVVAIWAMSAKPD
jgi:uncharacterized membrane protein